MMLTYDDISLALPNMSYLTPDKSSEQTPQDGMSSKYAADGKPSVLIFGNDIEIRFLLKTILDLWNYNSEESGSVEEAIRFASRRNFDLVLMDTKLSFPDSFAEMRVMQKSFLKNSPFILLSGHVQNDVRLSALAAGAADFFVKPINLDLLEEAIKIRIAEAGRIKQVF